MANRRGAPLSPMQAGMLFRVVEKPRSGIYVLQVVCTLEPSVDHAVLERAWHILTSRHDALRGRLDWTASQDPSFVTDCDVGCSIERLTWESDSKLTANDRLDAFLKADRLRGFKLDEAPLHRLTLIQCGKGHTILVWTLHHVILDRRAIALALAEVVELYRLDGQASRNDRPAPASYLDYLSWAAGHDWPDGEKYWRHRLAAPLPARGVRSVRSGAEARNATFGEVEIDICTSLDDVAAAATRYGVTVNAIVQTTWALVISEYVGENDVVFGATRACRNTGPEEFRQVLGVRANTTPIRVRSSPSSRVGDVLRDVRAQHIALRQFENTPASSIRRWSGALHDAELFDTLVVFERKSLRDSVVYEAPPMWQPDLRRIGYTHYPLTLIGHEGPPLTLRIDYRADAFDGEFVRQMAQRYGRVLEQLVTRPEGPVGELELVSAAERHKLLVDWNATSRVRSDETVHGSFELQVSRTPDAIAVVDEVQSITYDELNRRANRLARYLVRRGAAGGRVGICMERSVDMIVAVLGTLKARAAYVPLDAAHPIERRGFMLSDSAAAILITVEELRDAGNDQPSNIVSLDRDAERIAKEAEHNLGLAAGGDDLLYVVYTSGSTGRPKGVAVPHRSMMNLIRWYQATIRFSAVTLQYASFSFDMASYEILSTLCGGGRLVLTLEDARRDVRRLAERIDTQRVEVAMLPGVVVDQLAQYAGQMSMSLPTLTDIICAGEQLHVTPAIVQFFSRARCRLHNQYGPSETGPVVTAYCLSDDPATWPSRPPIGRPIDNIQVFVLDRHGQPAPVGVIGELCVAGVGLAAGYWQREELTAERFRMHAFGAGVATRVYHTGDQARWRPDGILDFCGREDDQIKIRGYRIELGEVEAALHDAPGVAQAAVVASKVDPTDVTLVGYVLPMSGSEISTLALTKHLRDRLPAYMIPATIVHLARMPLTSSGKIDRHNLPVPVTDPKRAGDSGLRTATEAALAVIWAAVLGVSNVGIHDNFFELGGHSLKAMRVLNRVQEAFNVRLAMNTLFKWPTIEGLARVIESSSGNGAVWTRGSPAEHATGKEQ